MQNFVSGYRSGRLFSCQVTAMHRVDLARSKCIDNSVSFLREIRPCGRLCYPNCSF